MRAWLGLLVALAGSAGAALGAEGCGMADRATSPGAFFDAGAEAPSRDGTPCENTTDCATRYICRRDAPGAQGFCRVPTGRCASQATVENDCYPNARCDVGSAGEPGMCTFLPRDVQAFRVRSTVPLTAPTERTTELAPNDFTLQWTPAPAEPGVASTTVAMIMKNAPAMQAGANQIRNREDVVWVWSSADPAPPGQAPAMEGAVPLRHGHKGLDWQGLPGPRWDPDRDRLADGEYVWFVFTITRGAVTAASPAQRFLVGRRLLPQGRCARDLECGIYPELSQCLAGTCVRRCGSNLDCGGADGRCDFLDERQGDTRRQGICRFGPLPGDGGV